MSIVIDLNNYELFLFSLMFFNTVSTVSNFGGFFAYYYGNFSCCKKIVFCILLVVFVKIKKYEIMF